LRSSTAAAYLRDDEGMGLAMLGDGVRTGNAFTFMAEQGADSVQALPLVSMFWDSM
jgi:hypothetical protein